MLPVPSSIPGRVAALLVVGVSARIQFDDGYRGFFELATAQVATAISSARAHEEERRRAEALAEIDRAKTAFFSNVSHEFRTPLSLMLAPVEDALGDAHRPLDPQHRERLETAHRNSLRLLKLVNTLLDFSRIEAGRVEARYEATDLAALTADLASNFRSAMDRAGLGFVVECPPLGAPVHVDRDMWEKIVLNLLSNAFKFTFDGEIAVTLRRAGARRGAGGPRYRHRDRPRGDSASLRAVLSGQGRPGADARRHGHRAVAGSGARSAARGLGPGRERPRPGKHVHRVDPGRPRTEEQRGPPHPGGDRAGRQSVRRGSVAVATRVGRHGARRAAAARRPGRCRRGVPAGANACWPTTTPTCGITWPACCASTGRSRPYPTARPRSTPRAHTHRTSCWRTS